MWYFGIICPKGTILTCNKTKGKKGDSLGSWTVYRVIEMEKNTWFYIGFIFGSYLKAK